MPFDLPTIPDNIATITASQLLGTLFNWGLYGVLSIQVYIYYLSFSDDKLFTKCLVYGTFLLETAQTALSTADAYYWFVSGYGNMLHLDDVYVSPWDTPLMCGIVAAIVQCFFAYRIWKVRKTYWWLSALIILTALVQMAGAFGAAISGHVMRYYSRLHRIKMLFPASSHVWLLGSAVCDIIIAGSMLFIFYTSKEKYQLANKILAKLVKLVVETNALTAGMALLSYIVLICLPDKNYFICTTLIMGKLYSNTLLVTFNNRIALRKILVEGAPTHAHGTSGHSVPTFRAGDSTVINSSTTCHIGAEEFRNGTRSQDIDVIEIKVLRDIEVHNAPPNTLSLAV